jgi:hypothetical protein
MSTRVKKLARIKSILRKAAVAGASATVLLTFAVSAQATTIIMNGSFETLTGGTSGQLGYNVNATGWTTNGYNFVFTPGEADSTGATGADGNLKLWGPGDGSANGLPSTSPDGGNYVAADGAYEVSPISQTVDGLLPGESYTVGFYWAGAQQYNFNGNTTEQWTVSLGSQSFATSVVDDSSHGFTGWEYQSFTYVATASSEVLSFLATGTPSGEPPFSLLDGVTMNQVSTSTPAAAPEPGTWVLTLGGLAVLGWKCRRKRL